MKISLLQILVVVTFAVTILNTFLIIGITRTLNQFFSGIQTIEVPVTESTNQSQQKQTNVQWKDDCNFELDSSYDAIFVYWDRCPHCNNMKPFVNNSTIKFYWINAVDDRCLSKVNLSQYGYMGYVPFFACLRKNMSYTGEFIPIEKFYNWTEECVS